MSRRFDQCTETCTTDCGHCKGRPVEALRADNERLSRRLAGRFEETEKLRAEVAALRQQLDEARARANEAARLSADARDRADWLAKEYQTLSEFAGILERDRSARDKWGLDLAARHGISEGMTDPWGDILGVYGMIAEHIDALNARVAAAEAARDLLFSELAEARRELRDGLSDRDLLTDVPPDQLVDEVLALIDRGYQQYTELRSSYVDLFANESRLLVVYRAAEAWRAVQPWDDPREYEPPARNLLAAVDAYRADAVWTPAKPGDTPGELVPGEGEAPQPVRADAPAEAPDGERA